MDSDSQPATDPVDETVGVERNWFRNVLAGEDAAPHFGEDSDWDAAFEGAAPEDGAADAGGNP